MEHPLSIKLQLKDDPLPSLKTVKEFEKLFNITYRRYLTFSNHKEMRKTVKYCPWFYKYRWLFGKRDELEYFYLQQLSKGALEKVYVKWIAPEIGYGLFADAKIKKNAFIGEYTGLIREINPKNPDLNAYCFHYPTRFFTWRYHYLVIDASSDGNLLRFINHSDKPNLQPLWIASQGLMHLILIASRDIDKDEELTFDYGKDYWQRRKKLS